MPMFEKEKRTAFHRAIGGPFDGQTVEASADYSEFTVHPNGGSLVPAMGGSRAAHYELENGALVWHDRSA